MAKKQGETDSWHSPDRLLEILKIISIFGAASWAVYLFLRFERTERELSLELLRSENARNELVAELQRLELRRSQLDVARGEAAELTFEQEIEIDDLGPSGKAGRNVFLVSYNYQIANTGLSAHDVTYVVIQAFKATLPVPDEGDALEVGEFRNEDTAIWKCVFLKAHYYSPRWSEGIAFNDEQGNAIPFYKGGGGTSELDAGETSEGSLELIMLGGLKDLVGFQIRVGIDGGKSASDRWRLTERALLKSKESDPPELTTERGNSLD